jgi:hypothetical protein
MPSSAGARDSEHQGPGRASKGRGGGYKEVTLVRYYKRFHSLHRAPLDEWVTEIFQGQKETTGDLDADYLKEEIKREFEL